MLDNFFNLPVTKSAYSKKNKELLHFYKPVVDNTMGMAAWLGYSMNPKMSFPKFIGITKARKVYTVILESSFAIQQEWYRLVLGRGDIYSNIVTRPSDLPTVDITKFSEEPMVITHAAAQFAQWQVDTINKKLTKKSPFIRPSSFVEQCIIPDWLKNTELMVRNKNVLALNTAKKYIRLIGDAHFHGRYLSLFPSIYDPVAGTRTYFS